MDKIDSAIQEVKGKVDGLELTAERVSIADSTNKFEATNVEDALLENKTSIQSANDKIANNTKLANQALSKANEAFLRGDNVKTQLVDKLISEGLDVSTNNTFEELIGNIALGKKWASGTAISNKVFNISTGYSNSTVAGIEVTGLSFKPKCVVFFNTSLPIQGAIGIASIYDKFSKNGVWYGKYHAGYFQVNSSGCYLNETGFAVPTNSDSYATNESIEWIAFE